MTKVNEEEEEEEEEEREKKAFADYFLTLFFC